MCLCGNIGLLKRVVNILHLLQYFIGHLPLDIGVTTETIKVITIQ